MFVRQRSLTEINGRSPERKGELPAFRGFYRGLRIRPELPGNTLQEKRIRPPQKGSEYNKINLLDPITVPDRTSCQTIPKLFEFLDSRSVGLPWKLRCISGSVILGDRRSEPRSNQIPNKRDRISLGEVVIAIPGSPARS